MKPFVKPAIVKAQAQVAMQATTPLFSQWKNRPAALRAINHDCRGVLGT